MKLNSRVGTLVLYDSENVATPVRPDSTHYIVDKVDVLQLRESIAKEYPSLGIDFVVFNKRFTDKSNRSKSILGFFKFLYGAGFEVVSKAVTTKKRFVKLASGENVLYHYEKCDLDTDIIEMMDEISELYEHIILVSGDDDMMPALLRARDIHGARISVISHRESMSSSFKDIDYKFIDEIMSHKTKDQH